MNRASRLLLLCSALALPAAAATDNMCWNRDTGKTHVAKGLRDVTSMAGNGFVTCATLTVSPDTSSIPSGIEIRATLETGGSYASSPQTRTRSCVASLSRGGDLNQPEIPNAGSPSAPGFASAWDAAIERAAVPTRKNAAALP